MCKAITSILETYPQKKEVHLESVETKFEGFFRSRGKKVEHFKHITGTKLFNVLKNNQERFSMQLKDTSWFVKLHLHLDERVSGESDTFHIPTTRRNESYRKEHALEKASTSYTSFSKPILHDRSEDIKSFFAKVDYFQKGAFVLLTGRISVMEEIEALKFIQWLCIYDFDTSSRKDGLMSVLENQLPGGVYHCTWMDEPRFSFHVTQWCLIRGSVREPATCLNGKVNDWSKKISRKLDNNLQLLDQYVKDETYIKTIVIWPELSEDAYFIQKVLSKMHETIDPSPEVFVLNLNEKHETNDEEKFLLKQIDPTMIIKASPAEIFSSIRRHTRGIQRKSGIKYKLPTFDKTNDPGIDVNTANHMKEFLDILYIEDVSGIAYEPYQLVEEGKEFLRGGTLKWSVYYAGDDPGLFDVKRDQMNSIIRHIEERHINLKMSGIIAIHHLPGSGASTLARRILWELRTKIPCVQLKSSALMKYNDIVENIKVLSEKTQMPILILLEGGETDVVSLCSYLKMERVVPVVLSLKRVFQDVTKTNVVGKFHLKEYVSNKEAIQFNVRYEQFCDTSEKTQNLAAMIENVNKGFKHQVFEFGLTTFGHEFKGIPFYVSGYLKFDTKDTDLNPTQRMLGYLALIYYYGHTSVPCLIFTKLLGVPENFLPEFDDLPYEVKKLSVIDSQHQHKHHIRICHHIMAMEILEQILTKSCVRNVLPRKQELSEMACRNLKQFGLKFIKDMAAKQSSRYDKKSIIIDAFIKIFIQRSDLEAEEYDNFVKKKPKFSRFITDIEKYSSPSEGIEILQKLTDLFPENASFHAHLGRKYSISSPEDEDKAEKCFKNALDLCNTDSNRFLKDVRMDQSATARLVHHMYGMHYCKRIWRRTKDAQKFPFDQMIHVILEYARKACNLFEISREYSHIGHEELYGLSGEIGVRIEVCNYIKTHLGTKSLNIKSGDMQADEKMRFIRESMTHVLDLITHSYSVVEQADFPSEMVNNIRIYKDLFQGNFADGIFVTGAPVNHEERRHRITEIKLKYKVFDILGLNRIADKQDIRYTVRLLEENFRDVEQEGLSAKGAFESDYRDWVNAIRLSQSDVTCSLKSVLNVVQNWCGLLNTPTSKYYLFILHILFLMSPNQNPKDYYSALELRGELKKFTKHYANARRPMEYLGKGTDFKCLIPAKFMERTHENNFKEVKISDGVAMRPRLLKGTIKGPNMKPQTGFIAIDVIGGSYQLDIFFVPIRTREKLIGKSYDGRRVEFILAFNVNDGFEAFNVKLLGSSSCTKCQKSIEFTSDDCNLRCQCGTVILKTE